MTWRTIWAAVLVALAMWAMFRHTRIGRGLYAVGGNPVAARYCGINIAHQQFFVYTLAGAFAPTGWMTWSS